MITPQIIESYDYGEHCVRLECDCSNGERVELMWDEEDPDWRLLWVSLIPTRYGFFGRISAALKMLFSKEPTWGEVVLTQEAVGKLASFLSEHSDDR